MKGFYVTLQRGAKTAWLLGPFAEHEKALAVVKPAFDKACELDSRAIWDAYGTSSITSDKQLPAGRLNSYLPALVETTP